MTWQRSVLADVLGDSDAKVILVEDGRLVVHVRDDDRDDRHRGVGRYLVVDQLGSSNLEGIDAAVLQDPGVLAVERHVGRDQSADRDVTVAGHLEIKVIRVIVLQCQQQTPRLAGVTVARSHYQDRVTSCGVLRQRRAVRRIQENGWLILRNEQFMPSSLN